MFGDADGMVADKETERTLGKPPGLQGSTFFSDALDAAARRLRDLLGWDESPG